MKRYLLFTGQDLPDGGWDDFVDGFDSEQDAIEKGREHHGDAWEWFHVVDAHTLKKTFQAKSGAWG